MSNARSALLLLRILATGIAAAQPNRACDLPTLAHEQRDDPAVSRACGRAKSSANLPMFTTSPGNSTTSRPKAMHGPAGWTRARETPCGMTPSIVMRAA